MIETLIYRDWYWKMVFKNMNTKSLLVTIQVVGRR